MFVEKTSLFPTADICIKSLGGFLLFLSCFHLLKIFSHVTEHFSNYSVITDSCSRRLYVTQGIV